MLYDSERARIFRSPVTMHLALAGAVRRAISLPEFRLPPLAEYEMAMAMAVANCFRRQDGRAKVHILKVLRSPAHGPPLNALNGQRPEGDIPPSMTPPR